LANAGPAEPASGGERPRLIKMTANGYIREDVTYIGDCSFFKGELVLL